LFLAGSAPGIDSIRVVWEGCIKIDLKVFVLICC